jgi:hypothetical protein
MIEKEKNITKLKSPISFSEHTKHKRNVDWSDIFSLLRIKHFNTQFIEKPILQ